MRVESKSAATMAPPIKRAGHPGRLRPSNDRTEPDQRMTSGTPGKNAHSCSYTSPSLAICAKWKPSQRSRELVQTETLSSRKSFGDVSNKVSSAADETINKQMSSRLSKDWASKDWPWWSLATGATFMAKTGENRAVRLTSMCRASSNARY